jgi:nitrite reductase/ring-hydroxylating ferredoxin subunit
MSERVTVAKTTELTVGAGIVAEVNGKSLAVFNIDGTFHVIDNTCIHRGGPLGEGDLEGEVVTCPWHGWEYNVKTGVSVNNPSACVASYPVVIEGDEVKVEL